MILKILLTGDVNLMNVTNPAGPFAKVAAEFKSADLVFSNLECCFYERTPRMRSTARDSLPRLRRPKR